MRHLIPSLCLALLLAETACSAPHAVKRGDSDARQKNAATRQRAESAYDELNGYGSTAGSSTKSGINTASKKAAATAAAAETYIDQDAINYVASGKVLGLPTRYNEGRVIGFTDNPAIVHYCGESNWKESLSMPRKEYFKKYSEMSWDEALKKHATGRKKAKKGSQE